MADDQVVDPVVVDPVVVDASKDVTATEDKTLLADAADKTQTPEDKAAAEKLAADDKAKADALKNETPEEKVARETKEKADADALKVPEKYDIKAPEGHEIDAKSIEALAPVFKELGLTNASVQKLVDAYAPIVKAQTEATQKAAIDYWNKETEGWKTDSLKMLGADAPKELAYAAKIINKIGTPYKMEDGKMGNKLRDILEESRVGNHPEITKLFIAIGKTISEDTFVDASKNSSGGDVSIYDHPDSLATLKK